MKTNNYLYTLLFLLLLTSCTAEGEPGTGTLPAGDPIEIIVGDYPAWATGESPETSTRTSIDPDDETKTKWEKGDKLWIRMMYDGDDGGGNIYGTATYTGTTWSHDLRWPVGAIDADFQTSYVGKHESTNDTYFWDTDVLSSSNANNVQAGQPVTLTDFYHETNRIIITHQSTEPLYLSGSGFMKMRMVTDYGLWSLPLANDEYLPINQVDTFYFRFNDGSKRVYKKVNNVPERVGDLNFSHEDDYVGYTYTINLGGGATNPNEEQEKAKERERFLAWADDYRNGTHKDFKLETDIDLTGVEWDPIVFREGKTFDGDGHTIKGLEVKKEGPFTGDTGLFGYASSSSTIKDLHVFGTVNVLSNKNTGGIVGFSQNVTIQNVSFTGSVTGGSNTGGIAGGALGSKFTNCRYYANPSDGLKFLGKDDTDRPSTIGPGCSPWDYEP